MTDSRSEKAIFLAALEKDTSTARMAYVAEACVGNAALQAEVEALLTAHNRLDSLPPPPEDVTGVRPTQMTSCLERPGTVVGPYKLIEQIGEGGFGVVFMADQAQPVRRRVALKILKPGMDTQQVLARFEAERQALAIMDHPHIAKVLDAGVTISGRPFFVMELVKGVPISKFCDQNQLTPRQRLELFVLVCQAIQHAHQKGIIHRDIKPSNVLVALYDDKPVPKVIDFGVAKATGKQLNEETLHTGFGAVVGTLEYMSPEQAGFNQLDIDTRSDIYSLGVLLYELLAGSPPFTRKALEKAGMLEMLRVIREEEPSKPSTKLSTAEGLPTLAANRGTEPTKLTKLVRGELDWIVMKALEKDRNRRYETANGFAMDVQRYLADEPVLACPPSASYRYRKFLQRNKGPVLAAAVVLLSLLGGILGTALGLMRALHAERAEAKRAEGERLAKERAEANFTLANEAVEKYLGTVTNDPVLRADLNPLRKKLLVSALPFLQKLAEQKGDDPAVAARRGSAYHRLAFLRSALGEYEAARQDSEAMRAIFARRTADFPAVPAYRHSLANSHHNLAVALLRLGRREEAEATYRQAIAITEALATEFPGEPAYRQNLAEGCSDLAVLLKQLGRRDEAEAADRRALGLRDKLAADFPNVLKYRQELALSHNNLGAQQAELGKFAEAVAAVRRALDLQKKLVADSPDEPVFCEDLARSHNNLGILLRTLRKYESARLAHDQAVAIFERLAAEFPTVPAYRKELAKGHNDLGILLSELDKFEQAEAAFRQALEILEKLAAGFPAVPEYRAALAQGHSHLADALMNQKKLAGAEASLHRAIGILEKLTDDFPAVPLYAVSLGGTYCNFGNLFLQRAHAEAALGWYQKAIACLQPGFAKEQRLVIARKFLRNSHYGRAQTLDALGRHAEAARDWERALELDDGDGKVYFRSQAVISRLRSLYQSKDTAGCLAAAAEFETLNRTTAAGLYDAARNRGVCAAVISEDPKIPATTSTRLAREQADLAMSWLQKAVAAGYRDIEYMKQDKDLAPLRERDDFQKLLAEIKAK